MFATLISCVAEKTTNAPRSVAFSPDGTKIVSGSDDGTIKVWDSGAPRARNRHSCWPRLTPDRSSGRQARDPEREADRARLCRNPVTVPDFNLHQLGGVFPGRDQDRVGVDRPGYQSLGFWCAASSKSPILDQY